MHDIKCRAHFINKRGDIKDGKGRGGEYGDMGYFDNKIERILDNIN